MEHEPDPTEPIRTCPIEGCPCRALDRSADAWAAAAAVVLEMDDEGRMIVFVPQRKEG